MTEYGIDTGRIAELLAELDVSAQRHRLIILKQAVVAHGGRWDLPSDDSGIYEPVLLSLQVFGVHAMAETLDELPRNWMQAAANILDGGDCRWSKAG